MKNKVFENLEPNQEQFFKTIAVEWSQNQFNTKKKTKFLPQYDV